MISKTPLSVLIPCGCFNGFKDQSCDFIREFGPWVLMLNHQQNFLGRTLLLLREHKTDLFELSTDELLLWLSAYRHWRGAILKAFAPDKFNVTLLCNEEDIHRGHLHWHFVPRYRRPVSFVGQEFQYDTPETQRLNYSRIDQKLVYPVSVRLRIKGEILTNWPKCLTT